MASAEIITIGTELLLGQLVDTNTAKIAAALAEVGVDVFRETSVGDNEERLAAAIGEAMRRSDAVICAGGLGPTVDDLTREAVAKATGCALETDAQALAKLREWFARVGRTMSDNNARQALLPRGATVLANPHGTAPGFALHQKGKLVIAMPGPPREMEPMLREHVLPLLRAHFGLRSTIVTRVLRTVGVAESEIDRRIEDLFRTSANPSIAVLAHLGQVDVKLTAKAETRDAAVALIERLEPVVRQRLGDHVFSADGRSLPEALGARLRERGWSLATAESCTGGIVGSMLTSAPGSSAYYHGGVVSYSDGSKTDLLDVAPELIERHGAVSEEVAVAMALGARAKFHATLGLSTTGVAGPDGGSAAKPVGLVYIGLANRSGDVEVQRRQIPGDREAVAHRASLAALLLAWQAARG
ncbi:MAG: competence/damage-inducible protein A [Candidatus Eremiobacteraeota bacterium]|nr:competence/damage-inducible protein A [Candidatus Eremiobacteraeota bacterium]